MGYPQDVETKTPWFSMKMNAGALLFISVGIATVIFVKRHRRH